MQTLEEPGTVERLVERLREEVEYLHGGNEVRWGKLPDDDCENEILNQYR